MVVVLQCLPLTDRTAQNIGDRYGFTREEIDAFASRSYRRAAAAGVAESGGQGNPPGRHPRHPQKTSRGVITGRRCRMATMAHHGIVRFGQALGHPCTPPWN